MAQRPVIFLAFANDLDRHLDTLRHESRGIDGTLYPLHDRKFIELYVREGANIQDVFTGFNRFNQRIAIFHYGGHASGTHLYLDQEEANAEGLAGLIGRQESLKLVFLNGCSTLGQVASLHQQGVQAVIATQVSIEDRMASDFAIQFYQNLAHQQTIDQAFHQAVAYLHTRFGVKDSAQIYRDRVSSGSGQGDQIPWGLYLNPEGNAADILNWKFPIIEKIELPPGFGESINRNYRVNEYLLSVLYEMADQNALVAAQMKDRFGNPKDPRELPGVLIESFPWPLGAQLRILFVRRGTMSRPGLPRLNQLLSTYVATSQFLAYLLFSQIWDEISEGHVAPQQNILTELPEGALGFKQCDFIALATKLYHLIQGSGHPLFLEELVPLFEDFAKQEETFQAYQFLEGIKQRMNLSEEFEPEELDTLCNEVEFCLATLLKRLAFLAKYQLVTIKDIAIFNPKREEPTFAHFLGYLNASDEGLLTQSNRSLSKYANSHSVLLVKTGDMSEFLNLSPFIIDKNAFEKEGDAPPNIYMLSGRRQGQYSYIFVNHSLFEGLSNSSDQLNSDDDRYEELGDLICRQFELFRQDINNRLA